MSDSRARSSPREAANMLSGFQSAVVRAVCVALVILPCMYVSNRNRDDNDAFIHTSTGQLRSKGSLGIETRHPPRQEIIDGQDVVWEPVDGPKGVLLLFHGCAHSAIDWWNKSDACPHCLGLPEEKAVVAAAVRRQYTVVALSSQDRQLSRCWDVGPPPQTTPDISKTIGTVKTLVMREGWQQLPLFAMGASSGGAMVALLPFHIKLQIMSVPPAVYQDIGKLQWAYPPTLFVHMSRDTRTAVGVTRDIDALKAKGIATHQVKVEPRPLTATFFSDRIDGVSPLVSEQLFQALQRAELLDAKGALVANPRMTKSKWQALLRHKVPAVDNISLEADVSPIFEELNLAFAGHELISDTTNAMLDWFELHAAS